MSVNTEHLKSVKFARKIKDGGKGDSEIITSKTAARNTGAYGDKTRNNQTRP